MMSRRLGTSLQLERAGGVDEARVVVGEARDARRLRAGGDDAMVERDDLAAVLRFHFQRVRRGELRAPFHHRHLARLGKACESPRQLRDDAVLELAHAVEIDLRRAERDAVAGHVLGVGDHLGGVQQRLRGDAADVEADAAERGVAFDEDDLLAEVGGAECRRIAAGTGAEHQHFGVQVGIEARERGGQGLAQAGRLRGACLRGRWRGGSRGRGGRRRGRLRSRRGLEHQDHRALGDLVAHLDPDFLDGARVRRRHFHRRLVGFERDQRRLLLHGVARLHLDLDDGDVLEVADVRDLDLERGHGARASRACRAAGRR